MADIPGLIEGAAQGAGLGIQFLKHLQRTRLLLHIVDACPVAGEPSPEEAVRAIESELGDYSQALATQPRWLVVNKLDLLAPDARDQRVAELKSSLGWTEPAFGISAATGAEFALIPPQNASGNWVKVVQRLPVRIEIDPADGMPPLRAGMTASIEIDTERDTSLAKLVNLAVANVWGEQ